jgi:hypothetical protein
MSNDLEKDLNLGGSIDRALSGDYELNVGGILKEAWLHTLQNFFAFTPAIIIVVLVQVCIFIFAFHFKAGDIWLLFEALSQPNKLTIEILEAIMVANFSYEVISAPLIAGASLMAMSHAAGIGTTTKDLTKGLQYTIPVIIVTLISLLLQSMLGSIFPLLSIYVSLVFSKSILLVCEKKLTPLQSLWVSFRAVNRKLLPIFALYTATSILFIIGALFYGVGLIFAVPFFFHVKGIIYRNMFGIKLKVIPKNTPNDKDDHDKNSQIFDA